MSDESRDVSDRLTSSRGVANRGIVVAPYPGIVTHGEHVGVQPQSTPSTPNKTVGVAISHGLELVTRLVLLVLGTTPEQLFYQAKSAVKPVITIYGPDGMIDKAAQKAVDRAMGIHKADEEYVTKEEHKEQLLAIIAISSALLPGSASGKLPTLRPVPQLAVVEAGGMVVATTLPVADAAVSVAVTNGSRATALTAAGAARVKSGKPQWWLRMVRESQVRASTKGYQVYLLKDSKGKVLYVGKSGGAGGKDPAVWLDRIRQHIKDPSKKDWIGEVDRITVTADLTEMEAFALEEDLIDQTAITNNNISSGEFSLRFKGAGRSENVRSALTKPTFSFDTDIVP